MKKLPYRACTATGETFDIEFPLHADTGEPVRVSQLVSAVLDTLDREIGIVGEISNGDVLQALAMALSVRAAMIHAPHETTERLARELVDTALEAGAGAARSGPRAGHA